MGNVVALRKPEQELEPDTFEAAWRMLTDTMRRRSDSKAKCKLLWDRTAKRLEGQEDLLARFRTYMRDDKDIPRTGGPGLQVLLRAGRLDHWTPMVLHARSVAPFEDETLRRELLNLKGEAFCRSYLDRCRVEGGVLLVPTLVALERLQEVAPILAAHGYPGMRKASPA